MDGRIEVMRDDPIATVVLNRPEKLNALNVEMREYLNESLWRLETDDDVRVVVLRAEGREGQQAGGSTATM